MRRNAIELWHLAILLNKIGFSNKNCVFCLIKFHIDFYAFSEYILKISLFSYISDLSNTNQEIHSERKMLYLTN